MTVLDVPMMKPHQASPAMISANALNAFARPL